MTITSVEKMLIQFAAIRKAYANVLRASFISESFSPSELDILIFLSNNPTINTNKQLRVYLDISKSLVCRSVDTLVKRGLLEVQEDKTDKRVQHLLLADASNALIDEIKIHRKQFAKILLHGISEDDLLVIDQIMKQINQNIEQLKKGENKK